jgi:hypothetical protein
MLIKMLKKEKYVIPKAFADCSETNGYIEGKLVWGSY